MGAKTVEEIVARFHGTPAFQAAKIIVGQLRAAGLLLEPELRLRISAALASPKIPWRENAALLRELAGAGVVDEPAPLASAPRRMVGRAIVHPNSAHYGEHDGDVYCAGWCRPVEPPTPRRMRGNRHTTERYHWPEHDEHDTCAVYPACQPVAPSSTEAAGPSPDPHATCCPTVRWMTGQGAPWHAMQPHHERETCASAGCSQVATSQPPHVHRWAAVTRVVEASDHEMIGAQYVVTVRVERVTREHCVADGCSEPPAVREVPS